MADTVRNGSRLDATGPAATKGDAGRAERGRVATRTSTIPRYSVYGQAVFYITYDDVTFRVSQLRIDNDASVPARLRAYDNDTPTVSVIDYVAQPGQDRTQSIPTGQNYLLTDYSFSFQFVSPT